MKGELLCPPWAPLAKEAASRVHVMSGSVYKETLQVARVKEKVTLARGKLLFQGASDPEAPPGGLESIREPSTSPPSEQHAQKTGCTHQPCRLMVTLGDRVLSPEPQFPYL